MIGSEIVSLAMDLTSKTSTTFLDGNSTNIYKHLNRIYGHRILDILHARVDKNASIQEARTTLLSTVGLVYGDNGFNGEYAFPSDLLRPTRFEVSFDGVTWKQCKIYDNYLNTGSEFNENQIQSTFSEEFPMVDFTRNSYKVRPLKTTTGNITNGIYIEYEKRQADFTDSTSPTEIEQNLQDILAWDLAKLEMVKHAEKYTNKEITVFDAEHQRIKDLFFKNYEMDIPTRRTMTVNFHSLPR